MKTENDPVIKYKEKAVVDVDGIEHDVLKRIVIPHVGWEMDNYGYVIKYNNQLVLVLSSHGSLYISEKDEAITNLKVFMGNLRDYIHDMSEAMEMLENGG